MKDSIHLLDDSFWGFSKILWDIGITLIVLKTASCVGNSGTQIVNEYTILYYRNFSIVEYDI